MQQPEKIEYFCSVELYSSFSAMPLILTKSLAIFPTKYPKLLHIRHHGCNLQLASIYLEDGSLTNASHLFPKSLLVSP